MNVASKLSNYSSDTFWGFGCGGEGECWAFLGFVGTLSSVVGKIGTRRSKIPFPWLLRCRIPGDNPTGGIRKFESRFPTQQRKRRKGERGRGDTILL